MVFQTPWLGTQGLTVLLTTLILDYTSTLSRPWGNSIRTWVQLLREVKAPPPRHITSALSVAPLSPSLAVRSTMGARGMRLALWLLTFSMLMQMLSSELFSPGVRKELCESGYLGGKQK